MLYIYFFYFYFFWGGLKKKNGGGRIFDIFDLGQSWLSCRWFNLSILYSHLNSMTLSCCFYFLFLHSYLQNTSLAMYSTGRYSTMLWDSCSFTNWNESKVFSLQTKKGTSFQFWNFCVSLSLSQMLNQCLHIKLTCFFNIQTHFLEYQNYFSWIARLFFLNNKTIFLESKDNFSWISRQFFWISRQVFLII